MEKIDLPIFAGPLDLLLHLIERQELDITAVSLQQVTQQYLQQVDELKKENRIEQLIDFLVIAARLALIKSRALLPQTPLAYDGEEEEEDPAEALVRQLKEYKQFKIAAGWLNERQIAGLHTYLRVAPPPKIESKIDMSGITVQMLIGAMRAALARAEMADKSVSIARPRVVTIEDQIKRLRGRAKEKRPFLFDDLLSPEATGVEVAVSLLAVLELIKRREIKARQPEAFGRIELIGEV